MQKTVLTCVYTTASLCVTLASSSQHPSYARLGIRWPALEWASWFQNKMEVANRAIAYVYTYASYVFVLYAHILMLTYLLVCLRMYTGQNEFDERLSTGSKGQ